MAAPVCAIALSAGATIRTAPGLADATVAGLGLPAEASEAKAARALLGSCFDAVKVAVLNDFGDESPRRHFLGNVCSALLAHDALSGLRARRYKDVAGNAP